jgi:rod shape-determining protein MreD
MKPSIVQHTVIGILIVILQITVFNHLKIFGAVPDVVLIYLFWVMRHHDRTKCLLLAASLGLLLDIMLDLWGMNMFAKIAVVMLAYNLIPKAEQTRPPASKMSFILLFIVFMHNLILIGLSIFVQSLATWNIMLLVLAGNTVFTTLTATFVYIFSSDSA